MSDKLPPPRYSIWQAIAAAIGLSTRAIEEARAAAAKPGQVPRIIEWQAGVHYEGAMIAHAGATWQAMRDTAEVPPHDDWVCVAERGADGRTPSFKGAWKAASEYEAFDTVMVEGSSFVAIRDAPGPCPGEGWRLLSSRGKSGPPGPAGPQGERGWPGPPGAGVTAFDVDGDGLLTLRLSDGSALTCDLYPVLARLVR